MCRFGNLKCHRIRWLFYFYIFFLLNRFEVSIDPDHDAEHYIEFVMRAKNGIMVNFKEQHWMVYKVLSDRPIYWVNVLCFNVFSYIEIALIDVWTYITLSIPFNLHYKSGTQHKINGLQNFGDFDGSSWVFDIWEILYK